LVIGENVLDVSIHLGKLSDISEFRLRMPFRLPPPLRLLFRLPLQLLLRYRLPLPADRGQGLGGIG
jgi:hypothetical protein